MAGLKKARRVAAKVDAEKAQQVQNLANQTAQIRRSFYHDLADRAPVDARPVPEPANPLAMTTGDMETP